MKDDRQKSSINGIEKLTVEQFNHALGGNPVKGHKFNSVPITTLSFYCSNALIKL